MNTPYTEMFTAEQQAVFAFIAESVFDKKIDAPQIENWGALMTEAAQQAVFAQVYVSAKNQMPQDAANYFNNVYLRCIYTATVKINAHKKLNEIMTEAGIPYVILKGCASANYYKDPLLRASGDVDFLVPKDRLEDADAVFQKLGFEKEEGSDEHGFHWEYFKNGVSWELHWEAPGIPKTGNERILYYLNDLIDKRVLHDDGKASYYVPSDFHHGLVMLLHTAGHMTATGIGLRHLLDWIVFAYSMSEDEFTTMFKTPLTEIGLWQFAKVLTSIGSSFFGLEERSFCADVDEQLRAELLRDIVSGGNFGAKDMNRINQSKLMLDSDSGKVGKRSGAGNVISHLNRKARQMWPATKKYPILLPIGWVRVLFRHFKRIKKGSRPEMNVHEMMSGAKARRSIYEQLELFEK